MSTMAIAVLVAGFVEAGLELVGDHGPMYKVDAEQAFEGGLSSNQPIPTTMSINQMRQIQRQPVTPTTGLASTSTMRETISGSTMPARATGTSQSARPTRATLNVPTATRSSP